MPDYQAFKKTALWWGSVVLYMYMQQYAAKGEPGSMFLNPEFWHWHLFCATGLAPFKWMWDLCLLKPTHFLYVFIGWGGFLKRSVWQSAQRWRQWAKVLSPHNYSGHFGVCNTINGLEERLSKSVCCYHHLYDYSCLQPRKHTKDKNQGASSGGGGTTHHMIKLILPLILNPNSKLIILRKDEWLNRPHFIKHPLSVSLKWFS